MLYVEDGALVGSDKAVDTISSIAAAIAYAALTDRMNYAVTMADTLVQLVHCTTRNAMVDMKEVPITNENAQDHANAISAAVYIATCRYQIWVALDSKDDS